MSQINPKQIIDLSRNIESLVSEIKKSKKDTSSKKTISKKNEIEFKIPKNLENILDPLKNLKNIKTIGDDIKKLNLTGIKESVKPFDEKKVFSSIKDPILNAIKTQTSNKFADIKKGIDQINKINDLNKNKTTKEEENLKETPEERKSFIKDVVSSFNIEKILSKKIENDKKESVLDGSSLKKFLEKIENKVNPKNVETPKVQSDNNGGVKEVLDEVKNIFKGSIKSNSDVKKTITEGIFNRDSLKKITETKGAKEIASIGKTVFDKIKGGIKKEPKSENKEIVKEETPNEFSIKNKLDKVIESGNIKKEKISSDSKLPNKSFPLSSKDSLKDPVVDEINKKPETSYNKKSVLSLSPSPKPAPKMKEESDSKKEESTTNNKEEFPDTDIKMESVKSNEKKDTEKEKKEKDTDKYKIDNRSLDEIKQILLRIASALESPLEVSTVDSPFRPDSRRV